MKIQINDFNYSIDEIVALKDFKSPLEKEIHFFIESWLDNSDSMIFQTSGSTGSPKSITVLKKHLESSAKRTLNHFNIIDGIILNWLSIQHIGGAMQMIRALSGNIDIHIVDAKKNPFESKTIQWSKIKLLSLVPYQLAHLLDIEFTEISKVKTILLGGSSPSNQLKQRIKELNYTNIFETYGMTETLSHIAIKNIVLENEFICLEGISISTNEKDCLIIEDNLLEIHQLITNDIVDISSNQSFIWKGRYDNIINTGSIKISPEELELKLSPLFQSNFIIYGEKHEQFGEIVCMIIEEKPFPNTYIEIIKEVCKPKYY